MKVTPLELEGILLVSLDLFKDGRGYFVERYQASKFAELGLGQSFVQDNHSRSAPGVLRGLHYQNDPGQGKLVGVIRGRIWDVVADIRAESPTFGRHLGIELNGDEGRLLWVPPGFAHGFCVLGNEPADVIYKVDVSYTPAKEGGIRWNDADLKIDWPIKNPLVSGRDAGLPSWSEYAKRVAL